MLVLTRRVFEGVIIRDKAGRLVGKVSVAEIGKNRVRIGFDFEKDYEIQRSEVDVEKQAKAAGRQDAVA